MAPPSDSDRGGEGIAMLEISGVGAAAASAANGAGGDEEDCKLSPRGKNEAVV